MPIQRVTRESLKRSPRTWLSIGEQVEAEHLIEKAETVEWTEGQRRRAAALQTKAWAIENRTWIDHRKKPEGRLL